MEEERKEHWPIVPRGTPNDGLPDNFRPVEEPPVSVGSPRAIANGPRVGIENPGQFFAYTLPLNFQLTPDIMPTRWGGGIGGYRLIPPSPSGLAANNAAAQSATGSTRK